MKKISCLLYSLLLSVVLLAQNDVSVLSSGTAESEEHAIQLALRNAIEQAFGTFVSANTTILNDELVSDEIATITRGNIKSFDILSSFSNENNITVNLSAVVSIDNLISYAKSKGATTEFAGAAYFNNYKLLQFNSSNTEKALDMLVKQVEILSKDMFDYELGIGTPKRIHSEAYKYVQGFVFDPGTKTDGFIVPLEVSIKNNICSSSIYNLVLTTVDALKISNDEAKNYRDAGLPTSSIYEPRESMFNDKVTCHLPVSQEKCDEIQKKLISYYIEAVIGYEIQVTGSDTQTYTWRNLKDIRHVNNYRYFKDPYFKFENVNYSFWWFVPEVLSDKKQYIHGDNYLTIQGYQIEFCYAVFDDYKLRDGQYYKNLFAYSDHVFAYPYFSLPETKTMRKPTSKELREIKKRQKADPSYLNKPEYNIIYGDQSVFCKHMVYVFIPENQMEAFREATIRKRR